MTEQDKEKLRIYHLDSAVHHNVMGNKRKSIEHTTLSISAVGNEEHYLSLSKVYKIEPPVWLFKKKYNHGS